MMITILKIVGALWALWMLAVIVKAIPLYRENKKRTGK